MLKILVVDDTLENRQVLAWLLGDQYKVLIAKNGPQALKVAKKNLPDLILLDIMMPDMDGYEVCQRLKVDDSTKDIPVIFITAKSETEDELRGFEVGGVDYITKPITPPVVLARVKAQLAVVQEKKLREDVERITRHDLKSPLNGILNYPLIIKSEGNLSEKQQDQLYKIVQLGRKMLKMINLSLDLYKMEQGAYVVNQEDVNLVDVLTEIIDENRIRLKSKRLTTDILINDNPVTEDVNFSVQGEKLLLYSMLSNLIKNAVEASPKKETITVAMNQGEGITISIHNQGTVPEEIRDNFFEKYATAGKYSGTGLGTYSARLIAETLGGEISLETLEENGTTIRISFHQANSSFKRSIDIAAAYHKTITQGLPTMRL